ncbi:MAG: NAD(+)/NADH kinase [Candidatus Nomurabacteria bacterium]|nr:NAD(+)/NADH kinase [Candidatus Nomurabacteria bacterium]
MKKINKIAIYHRGDNPKAIIWEVKIKKWLKIKYPEIQIDQKNPNIVIVLGGDGTILDATHIYKKSNPIFFGLNLGHVGFLASVRSPKDFLAGLDRLIVGDYHLTKRMMLKAGIIRDGIKIIEKNALNEVVVQNVLSVSRLEVWIDGHLTQEVKGGGVLVSTGTGSTAFNLSLHGPIVMPDIRCFVVTEMLDHNTPTPSIVVKRTKSVRIVIKSFRKRGELLMAGTLEPVDMVMTADGAVICPLEVKDEIIISEGRSVRIAEIDKDYFFKSVKSKFSFH